mgnify:CR=1 FL=1
MTSIPEDASPADRLRATPAPDDAGAQTADRYEWQAMVATADALSLYFKSLGDDGVLNPTADGTLICEHHEDWALIEGTVAEIVSGKHREPSRGPFSTYKQLLDEGGVSHLYQRWVALGRGQTCRLVTSGGLSNEGAKVTSVCVRLKLDPNENDSELAEIVSAVARVLNELDSAATATDADARAFLASLSIQDGLPRRDHLPDMAGRSYGLPVAERLGRPDAAEAIWQAVLSLVRARMRAAGPSVGGALPTVLGTPHDDLLAPRTLLLADIDVAVRVGLSHVAGYAPLPRVVKANRMAIKMARGGCNDNSIERADELRLQYRRYIRALRSNPSTRDRQGVVTNLLLRVVDEASRAVQNDSAEWGDALWAELDRRFRAMEGTSGAHGLSADLLLGGASELADRCRAWFTDRFDAQSELTRLKEGGIAS